MECHDAPWIIDVLLHKEALSKLRRYLKIFFNIITRRILHSLEANEWEITLGNEMVQFAAAEEIIEMSGWRTKKYNPSQYHLVFKIYGLSFA